MSSYFEITISSRQLTLVVAAIVALLLVAFGLGVGVGLQQENASRPAGEGLAAVRPEPTFQPSSELDEPAEAIPTPEPTPAAAPAVIAAAPTAALPTPMPASPPPTTSPTEPPLPTLGAGPRAGQTPIPRLARGHWVQVAALSSEPAAQNLRRRVMRLGYTPVQVVVQVGGDGKYRVRVGPFPDQESAARVAARLEVNGFAGAYVLKE